MKSGIVTGICLAIFFAAVLGSLGFHARVMGMIGLMLGAVLGLVGAIIEHRRKPTSVGDILWRVYRGKFNRS